jgi:hypothetical protein
MEKDGFPAGKTMAMGLVFTLFLAAILLEESQTQKEDPFTELYYNNISELPQTLRLNQTYNFSFTINNRETEEQIYLIRARVEYEGKKKNILTSDVKIDPDQSMSFPVSFNMNESFAKAKIGVRLDNLGHEIHFWAKEENDN